ncbi:MAG: S24 family peptidase [Planctomycetes bacterium]|nr:S24 family peptidase [Planctomycetota bacterium]
MAVSKIERGTLRRVEIDFLAAIVLFARDRGYSLVWLLTGEGRMRGGDRGVLEEIDDRELMIEIGRRRIGDTVHQYIEELQGVIAQRSIDVIESEKGPTGGEHLIGPEDLPADWPAHWVPIVNAVAAGDSFVDTLEADAGPPGWATEYVAVEAPPDRAIAVRVVGNSMLPRYASGDILVIDPAVAARPGQPAAIVYRADDGPYDTRALVKIWRPGRRYATLASENPEWKDLRIPLDHVKCAYAIWRHLRK